MNVNGFCLWKRHDVNFCSGGLEAKRSFTDSSVSQSGDEAQNEMVFSFLDLAGLLKAGHCQGSDRANTE